ncbi:MAG TPA: diphosphate--fructose-6-phosphate 1-phosphotransferase [Rectinemataceae bacterium]|nr:diphosphate--fructose-6-phosphate 1-phosphotransferase [Rectinemataceae bacterium]
MRLGNFLLAQSGGPTAVLNASAAGAALAALSLRGVGDVWAAREGLLGLFDDDLIDLRAEGRKSLRALSRVPGAAFGSCRRGLLDELDRERALAELKRRDVRLFLYIGGNDSMRTAADIDTLAADSGYELVVVGVPKTIDNDLLATDHCPGYGSAAKYIATTVMEAGLDTEALSSSDRVNVIETMGRDSGWLAAASTLGRRERDEAPNLVLLPESAFDEERFCSAVESSLGRLGRCVVAVAEGVKRADGSYLSAQGGPFGADHFGNVQLGGAALAVKAIVESRLGAKTRYSMPSTAQRVAGHWASGRDLAEAAAAGRAAVRMAAGGEGGRMVTLERLSDSPYRCGTGSVALSAVAGRTRTFPAEWLSESGMDVTEAFAAYALPLLAGESRPRLRDGLPEYPRLKSRQSGGAPRLDAS